MHLTRRKWRNDHAKRDGNESDGGRGMLERFPVPAGPLPPAGNPEFPAVSATASLSARWHEIQALFVPPAAR
jgi:hypothetical protein